MRETYQLDREAVRRFVEDGLTPDGIEEIRADLAQQISEPGRDWNPLTFTVRDRDAVGVAAFWGGQVYSLQWRQDTGVPFGPAVPASSMLRQVGRFDRAVIRAILEETMRQLDAIDAGES